MWSDEFKSLDTDIWKQTVTGKNGDRTFQFYSSDSNNRYIISPFSILLYR